MGGVELGGVVAAAQAGDEGAFTELVQRYRRELRVHCYRMLGSVVESEDLVQEIGRRGRPGVLRAARAVGRRPRRLHRGSSKYAPPGDMRFLATSANRQPAVALYLRSPGDAEFQLISVEVLRVEGDKIAEIVDYSMPEVLAAFGLPQTLA